MHRKHNNQGYKKRLDIELEEHVEKRKELAFEAKNLKNDIIELFDYIYDNYRNSRIIPQVHKFLDLL